MSKLFIYDVETFKNCFTAIFKVPGEPTEYVFTLSPYEDYNNEGELREFLDQDNVYVVGYNNDFFDGQVIEYIRRSSPGIRPEDIYEFSQEIISENKRVYWPRQMKFKQIDLQKIWGYNNKNRWTSLKWLEFTMRRPKLRDLPFDHDTELSESRVKKLITYNRIDIDSTEEFWNESDEKMDMRRKMAKRYKNFSVVNKSDIKMGEFIFVKRIQNETGRTRKELKKKARKNAPSSINFGDLILPYIDFESDTFRKVIDEYNDCTIYEEDGEFDTNGIFKYITEFAGIDFEFGVGGLHASVTNKTVVPRDDQILLDVDVSSFYPNIAIQNRLYPEHVGDIFCDMYEDLYKRRQKYEKGTVMNSALKLALNAVFGKSRSIYSPLYDLRFTFSVTVNGQLLLAMLAEKLANESDLIQVNTDGLTVLADKEKKNKIAKICMDWEKKTKLDLEYAKYSRMDIRDVNNYHAQYQGDGDAKRIGIFERYKDITEGKDYNKSPVFNIIPKMWDEYLQHGTPMDQTMSSETNIFEFLGGIKKKKSFNWELLKPDMDTGVVSVDINSDRALRFYFSKFGHTIKKIYNMDRVLSPARMAESTITPLQDVKDTHITRYPDLNFDYYLSEAKDLTDELEEYR